MTPALEDMSQIGSNGMALALTAALLTAWFAMRPESWRNSPVVPGNAGQSGIEISLQQAPAETLPAPARAPPPQAPRKVPTHRVLLQQYAAELPVPAEHETPVERDPVPEGGALVESSDTPASADLEAQYAAGLRADIDRRTRPPDSAQYRLHRPSGEVRVGFVVMRNGEPKVVRVLRSSGSSILDDAAVAIVASGRYPPMPVKVFAGEAEHVFAVTIEFRAVS